MTPPPDPRLDRPPGLWVAALVRLLALVLPRRGGAPQPALLRRVLVVRTDDRVGNALLTLPLVRALQAALPDAQVDLLLSARRMPVVAGLPGLRVIPFEKRDAFRRPFRFLRLLRELRAAGYDAALDAAHWHAFSLTSALVCRWAGRRWVIGSQRGPLGLYTQTVPLPPEGLPEVQAKVALLSGLGLAVPPSPPLETALGSQEAEQRWLSGLALGLGLSGGFVAAYPGARKADHRLGAEVFARVAAGLHAAWGLPTLVLWGPGEEEIAREVCAQSPTACRMSPPTSLSQLAAAFRAAALVVSNDTGPMHLAVACGAKTLALLAAPSGLRWGHPGPRFAALVAQDHSPEQLAQLAVAASRTLLTPAARPETFGAPPGSGG